MEEADPDPRFEKKNGRVNWNLGRLSESDSQSNGQNRKNFLMNVYLFRGKILEKENNPVARIDILPAKTPVSDEKGLRHIRFSNGTRLIPENQEIEYFKRDFQI